MHAHGFSNTFTCCGLPESEVRIGSIWSLLQPDILPICSHYKEEHAISSEYFNPLLRQKNKEENKKMWFGSGTCCRLSFLLKKCPNC